MTPLLVTLPYCAHDVDMARRLLTWIAELNKENAPHSCLLLADNVVPIDTQRELKELATSCHFSSVEALNTTVPPERQGWPKGPNFMFQSAMYQIQHRGYKLPWLWLETDAVPLVSSWLHDLALAYNDSPKRYVGVLVKCDTEGLPPVHVPGTAIYPHDAFNPHDTLGGLWFATTSDRAFDMAAAGYLAQRTQHTNLIQHLWGDFSLPPTFELGKVNSLTEANLSPDAVLFHRVKDDSLINLLRQRHKPAPSRKHVVKLK
jgi:hypothetical protein